MKTVDDNANAIARKATEVVSKTNYRIKTTAKIDSDEIEGMTIRSKGIANLLDEVIRQLKILNIQIGEMTNNPPEDIL